MIKDRIAAFVGGLIAASAAAVIVSLFVFAGLRGDLEVESDRADQAAGQVARLEAELAETVLAPILDPVAAYCRGVNDGFTIFGIHNSPALAAAGILYQEPTVDQLAEADANCYEGVSAGTVLPGGRGPLVADETGS